MSKKGKNKKLIVIDGNSLINRAYYAIQRPMLTKEGLYTQGVYGFLNILLKIREEQDPGYMVVAFDLKGPTFRHEEFKDYKAGRKKMPPELAMQIPLLKELLEHLKIPRLEAQGFEADDLIGTVVKEAEVQGYEPMIITGDKDALQLASDKTRVLITRKGISEFDEYDSQAMIDKYGFTPEQFIDFKGLMGDPSDNIPGVPGVGEKTAQKLIVEYGSVENLIAELDNMPESNLKNKIAENVQLAILSRRLAEINTQVPVEIDLESFVEEEPDYPGLIEFYKKLEFNSFLKRLKISPEALAEMQAAGQVGAGAGAQAGAGPGDQVGAGILAGVGDSAGVGGAKNVEFTLIDSEEDLSALEDMLAGAGNSKQAGGGDGREAGTVALKTFGNKSHIDVPKLWGIAFSAQNRCLYVDCRSEKVLKGLKSLISREIIKFGGHGLKDDYYTLLSLDFDLRGVETVFDTEVAQYLLQPGRRGYDFESLVMEHYHDDILAGSEEISTDGEGPGGGGGGKVGAGVVAEAGSSGSGQSVEEQVAFGDLLGGAGLFGADGVGSDGLTEVSALSELAPVFDKETEEAKIYAQKWANYIFNLWEEQEAELAENELTKVFREVELPLIRVLAAMEFWGIKVDRSELEEQGELLRAEIEAVSGAIYEKSGQTFNISSPKQLGTVLFEDLKLPPGKKTKTGYSTDVEVLEGLKDQHEIIDYILDYRSLTKLNGTYVEGLIPLIHKDGRIHAHFQQTVAATGRISCTEPNLQNIPIKQERGRQIRKVFIPESEGWLFVAADYSQIELRVLAHLSGDPSLIEGFEKGVDIHRATAARVFDVDEDKVTDLQRSNAKAVNFGVIYGMSGFGLGVELGISRFQAEKYIEEYFNKHPEVRAYMDGQIEFCKANGYVSTIMGRRRPVPEIRASSFIQRQAGERLAMNSPIQGSAADIIKLAMNNCSSRLREEGLKSKLILQVHDELIIEAHKSELDNVKKLLKETMENAVKLRVPLVAEINEGSNWYQVK